jgi:uncharacterized metal-binding protein YceD (DUF177 family)
MHQDEAGPPLAHKLRVIDIEDNAPHTIEPTGAEMAAISSLLDLVALDRLSFEYRLRRGGGGRVHLSGRLKADVTQTCVVSLEPVPSAIDVPVDAEFWPASLLEDFEHRAEDPRQAGVLDWPEPITDGTIDLGPVIYETLATALEPYPKKAGASFQWSQGAAEAEAGQSGPFAALSQLKKP